MRKSILCAALVGIAVFAGGAGLSASAAAGPRAEGTRGQKLMATPMGRLLAGRIGRRITLQSELNLTDAQKQAVKQTLKSHKQEISAVSKPLAEKKRALRDAVQASSPDDAAIRKAATDLGSALGDAGVTLAKVRADVTSKAQLTPEQSKKISQFRAGNDSAVDEFFKQMESAQ